MGLFHFFSYYSHYPYCPSRLFTLLRNKHLRKTILPFMDTAVSMSDPDEALDLSHIRFQLM